MKTHISTVHRHGERVHGQPEFTACLFQTAFSNHSPAFQVRRPVLKQVSSFETLLETALAAVPQVSVSAQRTMRDVTPFLRKYSWITHLAHHLLVHS
jgi:hypothetical protein